VSPTSSTTHLDADTVHKQLDILIVDDSRLNRKMLCKVLRCKGHVCDEAEDGLEAVKKVEERMRVSVEDGKPYFDVILMDFVMPNMDGPTGTLIARSRDLLK
jgi:CheY-like chemotaxis protein